MFDNFQVCQERREGHKRWQKRDEELSLLTYRQMCAVYKYTYRRSHIFNNGSYLTEQTGRQRELAPSGICDAWVGESSFSLPTHSVSWHASISLHPLPCWGTVQPQQHCCSLAHSLTALQLELGKYGAVHIVRAPAGWRGISKLTLQTLAELSSFGSEWLLQIIWFIPVFWLMGRERWERGKGTSVNETGKLEHNPWSKYNDFYGNPDVGYLQIGFLGFLLAKGIIGSIEVLSASLLFKSTAKWNRRQCSQPQWRSKLDEISWLPSLIFYAVSKIVASP